MKNTILRKAMLFVLMVPMLFLASCIEEYNLPELEVTANELYACGEIKVGAQSYVSVQRATPLSKWEEIYVDKASVYVVGDNGFRSKKGVYNADTRMYEIDTYDAKPGGKYRMEITVNGDDYATTYMEVLEAPEISRIYYEINKNKGSVEIYADVDKLNGNTKYMWTYEENFEVKAPLRIYETVYDGGFIVDYNWEYYKFYDNPNYHNECWAKQNSGTINLYNASALKEDRIKHCKVAEVSGSSIKFDGLYCITVFFNALSGDAFSYYTELQRLTEQKVTLYPPTPTDLRGNITCLTNKEKIMRGTITSSVPTVKRMFIDREEVKEILSEDYGAPYTVPGDTGFTDDQFWDEVENKRIEGYLIWSTVRFYNQITPSNTRFYYPHMCSCIKRGGTPNKPDWWPN